MDLEFDNSYYHNHLLNQLKSLIVMLGNWKNLPQNILESKCYLKEVNLQ